MAGKIRVRKPAPKLNVLCLGMSYPCVERQLEKEGVSWDNIDLKTQSVEQTVELVRRRVLTQMDGRDLARCIAMELTTNTISYTVSQEAGAEYDPSRHLTANFNRRNFVQQIKSRWGEKIKFSQIILDYFWIPNGTWMMQHWTRSFFLSTLPAFVQEGLLEYDSGKKKNGLPTGVIYLPFCFHVIKQIVSTIDTLSEFYTISFVYKSELQEHALWTGTSKISPQTMQEWLGKQIDQEEIYCTFSSRDVSECIEDAHVTKHEVEQVLRQIEDFGDVRMIKLRPLKIHTLLSRSLRPDRARCKRQNIVGFDVGGFVDLKPPDEVVRGYDELLTQDDSVTKSTSSDNDSVRIVSEDAGSSSTDSVADDAESEEDADEYYTCDQTKKPQKKRVLELLDLTLPLEPNLSQDTDLWDSERRDFNITNKEGSVIIDGYESFSKGDFDLRSPRRTFESTEDYEDFCQKQIEARRGVNLLLNAFDRIEEREYVKITTPVKVIGPVKQDEPSFGERKKKKPRPRRLLASLVQQSTEKTPSKGIPIVKKRNSSPKKTKNKSRKASGGGARKRCKAHSQVASKEGPGTGTSSERAEHEPLPASPPKIMHVVHKKSQTDPKSCTQRKHIVNGDKEITHTTIESNHKSKPGQKKNIRVSSNTDESPIPKKVKQTNVLGEETLLPQNLFSSLSKASSTKNASPAIGERYRKGGNHRKPQPSPSHLATSSPELSKSACCDQLDQQSNTADLDPRQCHEEVHELKDRLKRLGYTLPTSTEPTKAMQYLALALPVLLKKQGFPSADIDRIIGNQMGYLEGDTIWPEREPSSPDLASFDQAAKPYKVNASLDPESYTDPLMRCGIAMQTIVKPTTTVAELTRMLVEKLGPKCWLLPICRRATQTNSTQGRMPRDVYVSYGNGMTTHVTISSVDNDLEAHISAGLRTVVNGAILDPAEKVSSFIEHNRYCPSEVFLGTEDVKWQEDALPKRSFSFEI